MIARDAASGLALVAIAGAPAPELVPWTTQRLERSRYMIASDLSAQGASLRPVFVGRLHSGASLAWSGDVWIVPARTDVTPGEFLFSTDGSLAGLVIAHGGQPAIVPGDTVLRVVDDLLARKTDAVGWLGLEVQSLPSSLVSGPAAPGVMIAWVDPKGPAATRLSIMDVVETAGGEPVASPEQWRVRVARLQPGESIALRVRRSGQTSDVSVTAGAPPATDPMTLGLTLRTVRPIGAEVVRVADGSAAARAGIREGDLITAIDDVKAPSAQQVGLTFDAAPKGRAVLVAITRGRTPPRAGPRQERRTARVIPDPLDQRLGYVGAPGRPPRRWKGARLALGLSPTPVPGLVLLPLGMALGPHGLGLLSPAVLSFLEPAVAVAIATLGVFVGLGLEGRRAQEWRLLAAASLEAALTVTLVVGGVLLALRQAPFDTGFMPWLFAILLGICAASSSTTAIEWPDHPGIRATRIGDLDDVLTILAGGVALAWIRVGDAAAVAVLVGQSAAIALILAVAGWLLVRKSSSAQRASSVRARHAAPPRRRGRVPVVVGVVCGPRRRRVLERRRRVRPRLDRARCAARAASACRPAPAHGRRARGAVAGAVAAGADLRAVQACGKGGGRLDCRHGLRPTSGRFASASTSSRPGMIAVALALNVLQAAGLTAPGCCWRPS